MIEIHIMINFSDLKIFLMIFDMKYNVVNIFYTDNGAVFGAL